MRSLIAVFFLFGVVPQQAGADQLTYHANLAGVISPMLEYNPRATISADEARSLNHYRVMWDDDGRLLNIAYFEKDTASDGAYYSTHEVRYTYRPDGWSRRYFNAAGSPATMWRHYYQSNNVHHEKYTRNGDVISLELHGLDGTRVEVGTGSYLFTATHGRSEGFVQRQYLADGTPNVIFSYLPFKTSLITKNQNGFLHRIINLDNETLVVKTHADAGFAEMRLNFDHWGNELGWDFRDTSGELVNRAPTAEDPGYSQWRYYMTWKNRELGLFTGFTERLYRADNSLFCIDEVRCGMRIARDKEWRLKSVEYLDRNDKPVMDPTSGYATRVYHYSDKGEAIGSTSYDPNGTPIAKNN